MIDWFAERNERWKREAAEQLEAIHAMGFTTMGCLAFDDPRDGKHGMATWDCASKRVLLVNAPPDPTRYGIFLVLVGPTSRVVDVPPGQPWTETLADAIRLDAVVLTVAA